MSSPQRLPKTRILGTGHYVPEKVVSNFDIEKMVDTSDTWITERTGIRNRHIAADGEVTSDMAAHAAKAAMAAAGLTPADIDMIIVATITSDSPMPACAARVQQKIGAPTIPSFDIAAACGGFIIALSIADQFITNRAARHILVIGAELLSRVVNWTDRTTCVLFGDGAGAVVVGPSDDDGRGVLASRIFTDGSLIGALVIPAGGSAEPLTQAGIDAKRNTIHMQGQDVFRTAVKNLSSASAAVLEDASVSGADVDWVVAHQANLRILTGVSDRMGLPMEKFVINIHEYGNTSSASIPIALDEAVRDGRIKPGQTILMCALGAGISWGAALVRM
jgi:3-oxoacyl-[acyl-carrier-protein] synthase-3